MDAETTSRHDRRRISALQKRADWLKARVLIAEDRGQNLSFDKQELGALEWAIETLSQAEKKP